MPSRATGSSTSIASARSAAFSSRGAVTCLSTPDTPDVSSRTASPVTAPTSHSCSTGLECSRRSRARARSAFAVEGATPTATSSQRRVEANTPEISVPVAWPATESTWPAVTVPAAVIRSAAFSSRTVRSATTSVGTEPRSSRSRSASAPAISAAPASICSTAAHSSGTVTVPGPGGVLELDDHDSREGF